MVDRRLTVRTPEWMIPHWWRVAYKIPPILKDDLAELLEVRIDEKFEKIVSTYVKQLVEDGTMPPADVAPAIINLANDFLNGSDITIRTGDYISIQNHIRTMK